MSQSRSRSSKRHKLLRDSPMLQNHCLNLEEALLLSTKQGKISNESWIRMSSALQKAIDTLSYKEAITNIQEIEQRKQYKDDEDEDKEEEKLKKEKHGMQKKDLCEKEIAMLQGERTASKLIVEAEKQGHIQAMELKEQRRLIELELEEKEEKEKEEKKEKEFLLAEQISKEKKNKISSSSSSSPSSSSIIIEEK
eukprot:CAMPEP_0114363922 /NCGR_PEP_ID=MMETSP0101-20121206/27036_1 /TAXON_ID=38822 ORGANISM="Pteridomonas danica, Strain PT" /NCGR_SAMPLE_ID=MMETSP0101 /ASSEMBLY_ACC=CAM_ASM_000211 /LENGTH=194 /DNA_ID=CAMNT_0001511019 /DNA_START=445 /DNA_END=1026 /DNA_ORIENTATION=+